MCFMPFEAVSEIVGGGRGRSNRYDDKVQEVVQKVEVPKVNYVIEQREVLSPLCSADK